MLKSIGHLLPARHWAMARHSHADSHELIIVLHGKIRADIGQQVLTGGRGDVLLYPCRIAHQESGVGDEPLETLFLSFTNKLLDSSAGARMHFDTHGRIAYLAQWMLDIFPSAGGGNQEQNDRLLQSILHEFARLALPQEHQMVAAVHRFVRANLSRGLRLASLAELAGMSEFHFSRVFAAAAGCPPMRFVRNIRISAARTLLQTTPLPLKTIASMCGFADRNHLSRTFRDATGHSPGSCRAVRTN